MNKTLNTSPALATAVLASAFIAGAMIATVMNKYELAVDRAVYACEVETKQRCTTVITATPKEQTK